MSASAIAAAKGERMATTAEPYRSSSSLSGRALGWSATLLVAISWISAGLFGAYILAFFGGMAVGGTPERWNQSLPRLHEVSRPARHWRSVRIS
jgi:hypothetical protein